jgi:hypothetical protein
MGGEVLAAIADLHAARLALQRAFVTLDRAASRGVAIDRAHLRVLLAEAAGTEEEAAVLAALLASVAPAGGPWAPAGGR